MAEIAEILGVSRQRVGQLIETYEDFPKPEVELSGGRIWSRTAIETWIASHPQRGPGRPEEGGKKAEFFPGSGAGLFSRFTDRARQSVVKAQEEARLLKHNYIGTEHLLLGLIGIGEGLAWQTLTGMGVTLEDAREGVRTMIGEGHENPQGHIPFTPRAKKVLELAFREALRFAHNYIGTEHVLLALIGEKGGVAWKVLAGLGLEQARARSAVIDAMGGFRAIALGVEARQRLEATPAADEVTDAPPACSFCGKPQAEAQKLVAGPGVYICDDCVALAADVVASQADDVAMPFTDRLARIEERLKKLEEPPEA